LGLQGMIDPPRPATIKAVHLPVWYSSEDDYWRSCGDCTGDRASDWFEKESASSARSLAVNLPK